MSSNCVLLKTQTSWPESHKLLEGSEVVPDPSPSSSAHSANNPNTSLMLSVQTPGMIFTLSGHVLCPSATDTGTGTAR